jgi:iron-sulfur cluster assembly protein
MMRTKDFDGRYFMTPNIQPNSDFPGKHRNKTATGVDGRGWWIHLAPMTAAVNYKIGNEKLVKVLEGASSHLRGLLDRQGRPDGALRIAVVGGGCSGLQYKMDLVDGPRDRDILVPSNGVNVVIDPKSALFVSGSELDFSDDLQQGGFKVSNPNAVVTCSCGESFAA